jgi:ectoine hydroxylase-related dioxygenase (phytanoyl-CoA dioxygenase family)
VTADALLAYRRTGFARVPGLLDQSDLAMLEREWSRLWSDLDRAHPSIQLRGHQTEGSTADRIDPAYPLSADLQALCDDPRLTGLAEQALGRRAVLFKDKLITKSSGTHGYGLHQDWAYWTDFGAPADHLMTLQIAIDPCDAENGALEVWPAAPGLLPPPADEPLDLDPASLESSGGALLPLAAGDILLLHPLAPHRSAPNRSDRPRRAYFITYVSAEHESARWKREAQLRVGSRAAY